MNPSNVLKEALQNPTAVTSLNLDGAGLTEFPEGLLEMKNLEKLSLGYHVPNMAYDYPEDYEGKSPNRLSHLPKNFSKLKKLRQLDLNHNLFENFPEALCELPSLQYLDISHNPLGTIPQGVGRLRSLEDLQMYKTQLSRLPEELGNLERLTSLDLSNSNFNEFPLVICRLLNLVTLRMSGCRLKVIPEAIGKMAGLFALDLRYNSIQVLPNSLEKLSMLQKLDLQQNQIRQFPKIFLKMPSLRTLSLKGNPIDVFPLEVLNMKDLTSLELPDLKSFEGSYPGLCTVSRDFLERMRDGQKNYTAKGTEAFMTFLNRQIELKKKAVTFGPTPELTGSLARKPKDDEDAEKLLAQILETNGNKLIKIEYLPKKIYLFEKRLVLGKSQIKNLRSFLHYVPHGDLADEDYLLMKKTGASQTLFFYINGKPPVY